MQNPLIFNFTTDISGIAIPKELNNPFGLVIPKIASVFKNKLRK